MVQDYEVSHGRVNETTTDISFDPYANLTAQQEKLVLGAQVSLWGEQVSEIQ